MPFPSALNESRHWQLKPILTNAEETSGALIRHRSTLLNGRRAFPLLAQHQRTPGYRGGAVLFVCRTREALSGVTLPREVWGGWAFRKGIRTELLGS